MRRVLTALAGGAILAAGTSGIAVAADAKIEGLLKKHNCIQCHGIDKKILGPAYKDVAQKNKGQKDAVARLSKHVKAGSKGVWGPIPMPPNAAVSDAEIKLMVEYILSL